MGGAELSAPPIAEAQAVASEALHTAGTVRDEADVPSYRVTGLTKMFPGILAVDNVTLEVRRGEIHGIIGKNGAGKTVLMSVIGGIYPATSGHLALRDLTVDLTRQTPRRARELGIALIPQEPLVAKHLSVLENLLMGRLPQRRGLVDLTAGRQLLAEIAERFSLNISADRIMGDLRIEDQQMLALGRALFVDQACVLLLDEITASLSRQRKRIFADTLRRAIADRPDISATLITHHIDEILEFCQRVTIMRDGHAVRTIDVAQTSKAELAAWIVGDEARILGGDAGKAVASTAALAATSNEPKAASASAALGQIEVVLSVSALRFRNTLQDLSFELRRGQVLGIAGLDGSGKDDVFAILSGLQSPDGGSIEVSGKPCAFKSPSDARARGIAYLPKKRDEYAVLAGRPVEENILAMVYSRISSRTGLIDTDQARSLTQDTVATLTIKTSSGATQIETLSGGNRQKVILGRIVLADPLVYLLDEPTRGVDLATKPELLSTIRQRLANHSAVIVTSESEDELIEICDRVLVLYRGKLVGDVSRGTTAFEAGALYRLVQGVGI